MDSNNFVVLAIVGLIPFSGFCSAGLCGAMIEPDVPSFIVVVEICVELFFLIFMMALAAIKVLVECVELLNLTFPLAAIKEYVARLNIKK